VRRWGFDGVGVGVCVWSLRIVGGVMKEGKGGNVAIYREDFMLTAAVSASSSHGSRLFRGAWAREEVKAVSLESLDMVMDG
jgi:hypothetical protein